MGGVAAAGVVGLAVGALSATAGVLGGPPLLLWPPGDTPGGRPPTRLMLNPPGRVGVGGVAAAGGIRTVGRAQWRPGRIQGGAYDGCVEGAGRGGHAAGRAG